MSESAAQDRDMGYVGNLTGATYYDHSKGLNHMESAATVEVEVSDEAMAILRQVAKLRNCTLNAALEEAIREFDPHHDWTVHRV